MTNETFIGIYFLVVGLSSIFAYDVQKNDTGERPPVESVTSFKYFYRFSQITYAAGVLSLIRGFPLFSLFKNDYLLYAGAWVSTVGILLFFSAKKALGEHYSPCSKMKAPEDIVMKGLYKYIRHPIYSANLLLIGGLFIATGSVVILGTLLMTILYYLRSTSIEEKTLIERFPKYLEYRKNTGRFIPRI